MLAEEEAAGTDQAVDLFFFEVKRGRQVLQISFLGFVCKVVEGDISDIELHPASGKGRELISIFAVLVQLSLASLDIHLRLYPVYK